MSTNTSTNKSNLLSYADISQSKFDKKIEFTPLITEFGASFHTIKTVGTKFYLSTNYKAPRSRVVMIDIDTFDPKNIDASLIEIVPQHANLIMESS